LHPTQPAWPSTAVKVGTRAAAFASLVVVHLAAADGASIPVIDVRTPAVADTFLIPEIGEAWPLPKIGEAWPLPKIGEACLLTKLGEAWPHLVCAEFLLATDAVVLRSLSSSAFR